MPKCILAKIRITNFELFIAKELRPGWGSMAKSWARCMADQMVNLEPDGWLVLTRFEVEGCEVKACDLIALHCWSLLRSSLISKWLNILSKQTLSSRKWYNLIPFTESGLHSPDQRGKEREYYLHCTPGIRILFQTTPK